MKHSSPNGSRTEYITINPAFVSSKYDIFMNELTKKYISTGIPISIKEGYVENINSITVLDNLIDYDGNIVYKIHFSYNCYKPVLNSIEQVKICIITESALLVDIKNILKIIIPQYDKTKGYKKGDLITIKITAIEIKNNAYNCVGVITD